MPTPQNRIYLVCAQCSKEFWTHSSRLKTGRGVFCSKECFQEAWPSHKLVHKRFKVQPDSGASASDSAATPPSRWRSRFAGFPFSGSLRPWPVTPQLVIPRELMQQPDYAVTGIPKSELAERGSNIVPVWSSPEDIENMRRAGEIAREVTDIAAAALRPGVTAEAIDKIVHAACLERGVYPSPLNYHNFPKSW